MKNFKGHIEQIIYNNPENSWSIARLLADDGEFIIIKGTFNVIEGDFVEISGHYVEDKKYGKQINVKELNKVQPEAEKDVIRYLSSGIFTGIGIKTAELIWEKFGETVFDVMDRDIERFVEIPGLTESKVKSIRNEWKEQRASKDIIVFLKKFNLSYSMINKLIEMYGNDTIDVVKKDPYILIDAIDGIGFKTADKIALSLGLEKNAIERVLAGIFFSLKTVLSEGHCYVIKKELAVIVQYQLELKDELDLIDSCIDVLAEKGHLTIQEDKVYLKHIYHAEVMIARKVIDKLKETNFNIRNVKQMIQAECEIGGLELSDEQKNAVEEIIESPISILTGGAGVGKTTTVKLLLKLLENLNKDIVLATPTGRAAQRMKEVSSYGVKTIHRLLEWNPQEKGFNINESNPLKGDFLIIDEFSMVDLNLASSLIRSIPRGMQVLIIGDTEQLPSVGAGSVLKDFIESGLILKKELTQIFRQAESSDIINISHKIRKGELPTVKKITEMSDEELRQVDCVMVDSIELDPDEINFLNKFKSVFNVEQRGRKQNLIKDGWRELALKNKELLSNEDKNKINNIVADFPIKHPQVQLGFHTEEYLEKLITNMIPYFVGKGLEVQVLCPMKKGLMGTKNVNKLIQAKINPEKPENSELKFGETIFRKGDRVIQTKNDYERNVFNGDIGYISSVIDNKLVIEFNTDVEKKVVYERKDLDHLELAYAITIHKSQGSEFDVVVLPIFNSQHVMLYRQLIYTGITRGKKYVAVFGEESALNKAIRNKDNSLRKTTLKDQLLKFHKENALDEGEDS